MPDQKTEKPKAKGKRKSKGRSGKHSPKFTGLHTWTKGLYARAKTELGVLLKQETWDHIFTDAALVAHLRAKGIMVGKASIFTVRHQYHIPCAAARKIALFSKAAKQQKEKK